MNVIGFKYASMRRAWGPKDYSWLTRGTLDTHIPSYGNPGVGYSVFWRRMLLVIVGFSAAAIVMYFPRPPSAGKHYRKVLSATLGNFQDRYALMITDFSRKRGKGRSSPDLLSTLEKMTIASADTLSSIAGPIQLLRFEFSSTDFTASGLSRITSLATSVNFNMFQVLYYSSDLSEDFRRRFMLLSGAFEEHFVGDFMGVLSLLRHSLESGDALPSVLPAPLTVRAFRDRVVQAHTHPHHGMHQNSRPDQAGKEAAGTETREEHIRELLGPVTRKMIENEQEGFRKYCIVISCLVGLLNALDEMVMVVKEELGESHVVDIEDWGTRFYQDVDVEVENQENGEVENQRDADGSRR